MGLLDIFRISQIKEENERLKSDNATLQNQLLLRNEKYQNVKNYIKVLITQLIIFLI